MYLVPRTWNPSWSLPRNTFFGKHCTAIVVLWRDMLGLLLGMAYVLLWHTNGDLLWHAWRIIVIGDVSHCKDQWQGNNAIFRTEKWLVGEYLYWSTACMRWWFSDVVWVKQLVSISGQVKGRTGERDFSSLIPDLPISCMKMGDIRRYCYSIIASIHCELKKKGNKLHPAKKLPLVQQFPTRAHAPHLYLTKPLRSANSNLKNATYIVISYRILQIPASSIIFPTQNHTPIPGMIAKVSIKIWATQILLICNLLGQRLKVIIGLAVRPKIPKYCPVANQEIIHARLLAVLCLGWNLVRVAATTNGDTNAPIPSTAEIAINNFAPQVWRVLNISLN
jgi:hypothetical protein